MRQGGPHSLLSQLSAVRMAPSTLASQGTLSEADVGVRTTPARMCAEGNHGCLQ